MSAQPDQMDELEDFLRRHRRVLVPLSLPPAGAGIWAMAHFHHALFGPGTWGAGGNLVAWVICGIAGALIARSASRARTLVLVRLARQHQDEKREQHQELRDMHQELKDHITRAMNGGLRQ